MRTLPRLAPLLLTLAACARSASGGPVPLVLPDPVTILEPADGKTLSPGALLDRIRQSDFVLLGELHDNPVHHRVRGALIASAGSKPAVVFEQFAASSAPIPLPASGESREAWLDAHGFDRTGWQWPLHRPVVDAAIAHARSLWGSGVSREELRSVFRDGESAAPADLRRLMAAAPLTGPARAALDSDLVAGHCGKLPATMIPGMRTAQEVRDASMTHALLAASAGGPAWLIAGNGHVRADIAVPRLLRVAAPGRRILVVGLLERNADGTPPDRAEQERYDLVIITPRTERADPCATFR